jgi:hypothetical protein
MYTLFMLVATYVLLGRFIALWRSVMGSLVVFLLEVFTVVEFVYCAISVFLWSSGLTASDVVMLYLVILLRMNITDIFTYLGHTHRDAKHANEDKIMYFGKRSEMLHF